MDTTMKKTNTIELSKTFIIIFWAKIIIQTIKFVETIYI